MASIPKELRHGHSHTPVYNSWRSMLWRCNNVERYAGVKICERWLVFQNFLEDMGYPPEDHCLERKDNALGYFKENCRWATMFEQARNRSTGRFFTFEGKTRILQDWCNEFGIASYIVNKRVKRGWPFATALTTPPRGYKRDVIS